MKTSKTILSLLLVLVLFASLSVPAFAEKTPPASINNQIKSSPGGSSPQANAAPTLQSMFRMAANSKKIKAPNAGDYFSYSFSMYADAPKGHSINAYDHWTTNDNSKFGYIYHGSRVYVLAEHGDSYCVLYYTEKNVLNAAWVPADRLTYTYPGRVYRSAARSLPVGAVSVGDVNVQWSKDNFVGTKTKYSILSSPVEDCVGFTLDYQLLTKSEKKELVLGPRDIYVNDGSGWTYVGYFDYDEQGPCHIEVVLSEPMDLLAVATVAECDEPNAFTYRQSLLDVMTGPTVY